MAHVKVESVSPAIAGTGTTRAKTTKNWLPLITAVGFLSIIGALLLALNRGIEVGSLVIRQGTGASMKPLAYDGDSLVTWMRFDLVVGKTYLIRDGEQLLHKRLKEIKDDQLVFDSINKEHETNIYRVNHDHVLSRVVMVIPTHFLWDGEGDVNKEFPGFRYPSVLDIKLMETNNQLRLQVIQKHLLEKTGGSAKYYGSMSEIPNESSRGFHVDLPPGEYHYFVFNCNPGAHGASPMVVSGCTPTSFGEKGTLIKSGGKLKIECQMPFSLDDVFVILKE